MNKHGEAWIHRGPDWNEVSELKAYVFRGGRQAETFVLQLEDCDGDFVNWALLLDHSVRQQRTVILGGEARDHDEAYDAVRRAFNEYVGHPHFELGKRWEDRHGGLASQHPRAGVSCAPARKGELRRARRRH
jgi:hypothetical protein